MRKYDNLPPRLQRRMKLADAKLRAAVSECWGPDSPLLALLSDKSEPTPEQWANQILDGTLSLPDVEMTPELTMIFGFEPCPPASQA